MAYDISKNKCSSVVEIGDRLAIGHNRHGPKIGGRGAVPPFLVFLGVAGPHVTQCRLAWDEAYLRIKWHVDPSSRLATTDMGRKLEEGLCPWGGAGSASNTMLPGPRATFVPSGILIHPAVWSQ